MITLLPDTSSLPQALFAYNMGHGLRSSNEAWKVATRGPHGSDGQALRYNVEIRSDLTGYIPIKLDKARIDYMSCFMADRRWYAFSRTVYDHTGPRGGCCLTQTMLVPVADLSLVDALPDLDPRSWAGGEEPTASWGKPTDHRQDARLRHLLALPERHPVAWVCRDGDAALRATWHALQPSERAGFTGLGMALSCGRGWRLMCMPPESRSDTYGNPVIGEEHTLTYYIVNRPPPFGWETVPYPPSLGQ